MKFIDEEHKNLYYNVLDKMGNDDVYHKSFVYLITLDIVCRGHINSLYDFEDSCIKVFSLDAPWQTSTSRKTTRLAFNLYTGHTHWTDEENFSLCSVSEIMCCSYAPYYCEAIKIRYPEYF